jgi:hypothetical protein
MKEFDSVYVTKYTLTYVREISEGHDDDIKVIDKGEYVRPYNNGYHQVWFGDAATHEIVAERDLHKTIESAQAKVKEYIQFRRQYLQQQMNKLDELDASLKETVKP